MGRFSPGGIARDKKKITTEGLPFIDIRQLQRQGYIRPYVDGTMTWTIGISTRCSIGYRIFDDVLQLTYRHRSTNGSMVHAEQQLSLEWTSCNYGGSRVWVHCPGCDRRVAILYYYGKGFYCRHCHQLTYASQQEGKEARLMRKARKIRERLDASENLFYPIVDKPKYMHQSTFDRLRIKAELANGLSWITALGRLVKS